MDTNPACLPALLVSRRSADRSRVLEELAAQDAELSRRQAALDAMAAQLKEQVGGVQHHIGWL
jgi:hypothetical protein